jgi:acetylornithine deacetylase/succinyl-diaminopimelate desuccinylase-like protein
MTGLQTDLLTEVPTDSPANLPSCRDLLERLVAIPSTFPPGSTSAICSEIAALLRSWGYAVEVASRAPGVDNIIARIAPIPATPGPCLVFNSHIDTVGVGNSSHWRTPPFSLTQTSEQQLAGLGAANCKGSAAVHLWLAQLLAQRGGPVSGEVVFTFVGDEENLGPNGTRFLAEARLVQPDLLILGAPTANQLVVRERGVMWVRIEAFGTGAHAGQPAVGDNAILRLLRLLGHLQDRLSPSLSSRTSGALRSTFNIGTIEGGENTNVVPAHASATIDRRLLPGTENVQAAFDEIATLLAQSGEPSHTYKVELLTGTNGFSARSDGPLAHAFQQSAEALLGGPLHVVEAIGASDGRYFADTEMDIVNFGPGDGGQGHAPNESVSPAALDEACRLLEGVLARLSGFRNLYAKPKRAETT